MQKEQRKQLEKAIKLDTLETEDNALSQQSQSTQASERTIQELYLQTQKVQLTLLEQAIKLKGPTVERRVSSA